MYLTTLTSINTQSSFMIDLCVHVWRLCRFVRSREAVQRVAELLHVLTSAPWGLRNSTAEDINDLQVLRRSNGEATHHDAVSGTHSICCA